MDQDNRRPESRQLLEAPRPRAELVAMKCRRCGAVVMVGGMVSAGLKNSGQLPECEKPCARKVEE